MAENFYQNAAKPVGDDGKSILNRMNKSHAQMAEWGQSHITFEKSDDILDIGCGGGANLAAFLKKSPEGKIIGIDYSDISVEESIRYNSEAVKSGRCQVLQGDVSDLPLDNESFDIITGFETVYFWPKIENAIDQIKRVLKKGGVLLICNETDDTTDKTYTNVINGMTVYSKEELKQLLEDAGFKSVQAYTHKEKPWVCVTAKK